MKYVKNRWLALALAISFMVPVASYAAEKEGKEGKSKAKTEKSEQVKNNAQKIADELNLTPEQREKMKTISEEMRKKVQAVRADTSLDQAARSEKLKEIRLANQEQIKKLLTPDQYKKWQEIRKERAQKAGQPTKPAPENKK